MKREEAKKAAAKSYASKMCDLCLDEHCKEKGLVCPQFKEYTITFTEGINWADEHPKNVWHPASEEPEGDNWSIICQGTGGNCWLEIMFDVLMHNTWDEYVEEEMIVKWAYINDLLPKGGEE